MEFAVSSVLYVEVSAYLLKYLSVRLMFVSVNLNHSRSLRKGRKRETEVDVEEEEDVMKEGEED